MHAVIFDIDGTLLNSASVDDELYRESVSSVLGPVSFRPSLEDYEFVTDAGILSQLCIDNSISPNSNCIAAIKREFVAALRSYVKSYGPFSEIPGAKSFLSELGNSESYAVAIATGGWYETATLKLDSAGFDRAGLLLATSDDSMDRRKIMKFALSKLGSDFSSITYYGDAPWDCRACESLGWQFVAVGSALGGIESYQELGAA